MCDCCSTMTIFSGRVQRSKFPQLWYIPLLKDILHFEIELNEGIVDQGLTNGAVRDTMFTQPSAFKVWGVWTFFSCLFSQCICTVQLGPVYPSKNRGLWRSGELWRYGVLFTNITVQENNSKNIWGENIWDDDDLLAFKGENNPQCSLSTASWGNNMFLFNVTVLGWTWCLMNAAVC